MSCQIMSVTDPGFPIGAPTWYGVPTPDAATFCKIIMSKQKNWYPWGRAPGGPPGSATACVFVDCDSVVMLLIMHLVVLTFDLDFASRFMSNRGFYLSTQLMGSLQIDLTGLPYLISRPVEPAQPLPRTTVARQQAPLLIVPVVPSNRVPN